MTSHRDSWTLARSWPALMVGLLIVRLLGADARTSPRAQAIEIAHSPPLSFEPNRGQTDPRVDFVARGIGHALFFTPSEVVFVLTAADSMKLVLRMTFPGANPRPRVAGLEELPGRANYFVGQNPANWHTNVPRYATVQYTELYPGIDLRSSGDQHYVAFEFVVRPEANLNRISLGWQGADSLNVNAQGDLVLYTAVGVVLHRKPLIYQRVHDSRQEVAGGYVRKADHSVGFQVAAYDTRRSLVITAVLPLSVTPMTR